MKTVRTLFAVSVIISSFCIVAIRTYNSPHECGNGILPAYMVGLVSVVTAAVSGIVWIVDYIINRRR